MLLALDCGAKFPDEGYIDENIKEVCFEDKQYFMYRTERPASKCPTGGNQLNYVGCTVNKFAEPSGFKDLKGGSEADLYREGTVARFVLFIFNIKS